MLTINLSYMANASRETLGTYDSTSNSVRVGVRRA
jgi:hypothetical protein